MLEYKYEFIKDSVGLLESVTDFDQREFRGCSEQQIETLEEFLPEHTYFPESYYEFLKFGGNGICDMLRGTGFYYPQVYALQKERKINALKEEGFFAEDFDFDSYLTNDLFIFYFHQGYFARFFHLGSGDDPGIFYYEAGSPYHFLLAQEQSFSQYFHAEVQQFVAAYQEKISTIDIELKDRVRLYRRHILDVLDMLEAFPASQDISLFQNAKARYMELLQNSYTIFDYAYYKLYESSYVFSLDRNLDSQGSMDKTTQELIGMMRSLEKEGKELVSYLKQLKAQEA